MRPRLQSTNLLLAATLTLGAAQAQALTELSDDSLSDVQGAGFAFALDNFSMRFAPESFIELTGASVSSAEWQRGDARYYGLSMTNGAVSDGTDWYATLNGVPAGQDACAGGAYGNTFLACPIGKGNSSSLGGTANEYGIGAMASVYDPYVLRVFDYPGYIFTDPNDPNSADNLTGDDRPTILELIGPSQTDDWRWSFWGELEVNRNGEGLDYGSGATTNSDAIGACNKSTAGCTDGAEFLQSQTIIHGKPTTAGIYDDVNEEWIEKPKPAILRLMQTSYGSEPTLGITYQSALSGDFRFSVRQEDSNPGTYVTDTLHNVPDFEDNEGMYFKNVDAFLPLGVLHYQAITLDAVRDGPDNTGNATGNFVIELTRIPNIPEIYNHFYCGNGSPDPNGCDTDEDGVLDSINEDTRGYVRWGDFDGVNIATGAGLPNATATDNGIYFVNPTPQSGVDPVTNIGISRIEGMRIHHMKITTLGANQ